MPQVKVNVCQPSVSEDSSQNDEAQHTRNDDGEGADDDGHTGRQCTCSGNRSIADQDDHSTEATSCTQCDVSDSDAAGLFSQMNKSRRVSFAEGVELIKQPAVDKLSTMTPQNTIDSNATDPNSPLLSPLIPETLTPDLNEHPASEPEGIYLGKPVILEDEADKTTATNKEDLEDS